MAKDNLINGLNFIESLDFKDMVLLNEVALVSETGYILELNPSSKASDILKNLFKHELVRIDVFQDNDKDYFAFAITQSGEELLTKLNTLINEKLFNN